jgi:hypothetical protein
MSRGNADFNTGRGVKVYYHGTDEASAKDIMKNGFKDNVYLHPDPGVVEDYGDHIVEAHIPNNLKFESPHAWKEQEGWGPGQADATWDENYYHSPSETGNDIIVYKGKHVTPISVTKVDRGY